MSAVNVIIDKELKVAFNSLATYIIYTVFFCITGFICWFSWKNVFYSGQASLNYLFNVFYALFNDSRSHHEKHIR